MSFTTTELLGVVLVVLFAVVLFIGFGGNLSFFQSIQNCPPEGEPIPEHMFWCKYNKTPPYDEVARDSVDALACAINSVGSGAAYSSSCGVSTVHAGFALAQSDQHCFGLSCVECVDSGSEVECTVKDFRLPENFGNVFGEETAKEYIAGYGEPSFWVWPGNQGFPQGEDVSWTGYGPWWRGMGEAALWAIPGGKAGAKLFGTLWTGAKKVGGTGIRVFSFGALGGKSGKAKALEKIGNKVVASAKDSVSGVSRVLNAENIVLIERGVSFAEKSKLVRFLYRNRVNRKIVERFGTFDEYLRNVNPSIISAVTDPRYPTTAQFESALRSSFEKVASFSDDAVVRIEQEIAEETLDMARYLTPEAQRMVGMDALKDISWESVKKTMSATGAVSLAAYVAARAECQELKRHILPGELAVGEPLKCSLGASYSSGLASSAITFRKGEGGKRFKSDICCDVNEIQLWTSQEICIESGGVVTEDGLCPVTMELGKVLMLDKGVKTLGVFGNDPTPFYAVSPCSGDVKVEETGVLCDYYEYTPDGAVTCVSAALKTGETDPILKETVSCGGLFSDGGEEASRLLVNDASLFEYVGGTLESINVPIGDKYSLTDIEKQEDCSVYEDQIMPSYMDSFSCYSATVLDSEGNEIWHIHPDDQNVPKSYFICGDSNLYTGPGVFDPLFYTVSGNYIIDNSDITTYCDVSTWGKRLSMFTTAPKDNILQEGMYSEFIVLGDGRTIIMLNDDVGEGELTTVVISDVNLPRYTQISDFDSDGVLDSISTMKLRGGGCEVSGVKVSFQKDSEEPNFCYTRESVWKQVGYSGLVVGTLLGSFFLEGMSGGLATGIAVGLAQGVIAYSVSQVIVDWPG